jgi:hypothetical protein
MCDRQHPEAPHPVLMQRPGDDTVRAALLIYDRPFAWRCQCCRVRRTHDMHPTCGESPP